VLFLLKRGADVSRRSVISFSVLGSITFLSWRGATPQLEQIANRIELDLWYINNWTLGLDMQIPLRTSFDLIYGQNAY
jgi:lipopolysaccharide/colanic/teichoic acid biosynthesis glycosyltransferase